MITRKPFSPTPPQCCFRPAQCRPACLLRVDARYLSGGGRLQWGDEVIALARVFEKDGKVAVCGLWTVRGATTMAAHSHNLFAEAGVIQLGGRNVVQGFNFMPRTVYRDDMTGARAECRVTGSVWRADYRPKDAVIVMPPQDYGAGEMEDTKLRFRPGNVSSPLPGGQVATTSAAGN